MPARLCACTTAYSSYTVRARFGRFLDIGFAYGFLQQLRTISKFVQNRMLSSKGYKYEYLKVKKNDKFL